MKSPRAVLRGFVRDVIMKSGTGCPMRYGVAVVTVTEVIFGPKVDSVDIYVDSDQVCWASEPTEGKEFIFLLQDLPPGRAATAADVIEATPEAIARVRKARDKAQHGLGQGRTTTR